MTFGLAGPSLPGIRATFDVSYGTAALHLTVLAIGMLVGATVTGWFEERRGRAVAASSATILLAAGAVVVAIAPSVVVSLGGCLATGVASAVLTNSANATLAEHEPEHATANLALGQAAVAAGILTAALVVAGAEWLAPGLGWRLAWGTPGLLAIALAGRKVPRRLAAGALPAECSVSGASSTRVVGEVGNRPTHRRRRPSPPVVLAAGIAGLGSALELSVSFWAPSYLAHRLGFGDGTAAGATAVALVALVIGRLWVGRLSNRHEVATLLRVALAVAAVASVPYLVGPALAGSVGVVVTLVALAVLLLAAAGLFPLGLSLTMNLADPRRQARASAAALSASSMAGIITPVVLGRIADSSSLTGSLTSIPIIAVAAASLVAASRRVSDRAAGQAT